MRASASRRARGCDSGWTLQTPASCRGSPAPGDVLPFAKRRMLEDAGGPIQAHAELRAPAGEFIELAGGDTRAWESAPGMGASSPAGSRVRYTVVMTRRSTNSGLREGIRS